MNRNSGPSGDSDPDRGFWRGRPIARVAESPDGMIVLVGRTARDNDVLSAKIHELTLQLFAASDLQKTVVAIEEALRSGFGADQAVMVLFGEPDAFEDIDAGLQPR